MKKVAFAVLSGTLILAAISPSLGEKQAKPDGKAVFEQRCASCHSGGGNLVKPAKPIAGSKVLANLGIFKEYLSKPPGHMPTYEEIINDPQTLKALYDYCKSFKKGPRKQAIAPGNDPS